MDRPAPSLARVAWRASLCLSFCLWGATALQAATFTVKKGATIQQTVDDASAGDTVVVPKGIWVQTVYIPSSKPGLKLVGKGAVIDALPDAPEGASIAKVDVVIRLKRG